MRRLYLIIPFLMSLPALGETYFISGSQGRLCTIYSSEFKRHLRCWEAKTWKEETLDFLPWAQIDHGTFASDNAQCAQTKQGLLCWNWQSRRFYFYRELARFPRIVMSDTHVCGVEYFDDAKEGRRKGHFVCQPNVFHESPPLISVPTNQLAATVEDPQQEILDPSSRLPFAVGDGFLCYTEPYGPFKCIWGESETGEPFSANVPDERDRRSFRIPIARGNQLCYRHDEHYDRSIDSTITCHTVNIRAQDKDAFFVSRSLHKAYGESGRFLATRLLPTPALNETIVLGAFFTPDMAGNVDYRKTINMGVYATSSRNNSLTPRTELESTEHQLGSYNAIPISPTEFIIWPNGKENSLWMTERPRPNPEFRFDLFNRANFESDLQVLSAAVPTRLPEYRMLKQAYQNAIRSKDDPKIRHEILLSIEPAVRSIPTEFFANTILPAFENAKLRYNEYR